MSKSSSTTKISHKRTKQLCAALKRAQVSAARTAIEFGQLLYVSHKGKVIGVDPRMVLQLAGAA
jgi:hypothetical protein